MEWLIGLAGAFTGILLHKAWHFVHDKMWPSHVTEEFEPEEMAQDDYSELKAEITALRAEVFDYIDNRLKPIARQHRGKGAPLVDETPMKSGLISPATAKERGLI
jgi:hypothetical protein